MTMLFPSEEWVQALMVALNESAGYRDAAQKWEGDLTFVVKKAAGLSEDRFLYLDLWHGECRSASELASPDEKRSEFQMSAPLTTWRQVIEGRLDPIRAIMTRKLQVSGPVTKILKSPKAALELVKCASSLATSYPE